MKKNLSRILSYTASAVAMSAILAVTVPAGLFGQNGGVFAGGDSCYYGVAGCSADENGTHAHDVTIGEGCLQQTISGGTFTGNYTITVLSGGKITGGKFNVDGGAGKIMTIKVETGGEITAGTFGVSAGIAKVEVSSGTISGGTFNSSVTVKGDSTNDGTITGGTFNYDIFVEDGGVISDVTHAVDGGLVRVYLGGTITGGTFDKQVELAGGTITGGTFKNSATKVNSGTIKGGTFRDFEDNHGGTIEGGTFLASCGTIGNYQRTGTGGSITGGTFLCTVKNGDGQGKSGSISGGDFWGGVENTSGTISGGSFYGTVTNAGNITGGGFVVLPVGLQEGGNIRIIPYPSSKPTSGVLISVVPVNTHTHITHTHSYSWVTVQEATVGQDGIEEYRCSCGDVQERCVIPASEVFVKGLYGAVKDAPQNGTATFDSGRLYTISDYVIKKLAERSDVTTVITFEYQKQSYRMTIPAGADYTALLTDQDYFYGYFYFANAVGAAIEAI